MSIVMAESENLTETLDVGRSDCLQGAGGRKHALTATSNTANPMVKVEHVWFTQDEYVESAVIENLIIDGQHQNVTGILLENVCKCQIRNITIRNCEVGIHIRNGDYGLWSEGNCLKHIRMENVKKGIVFTTKGPYNPTIDQEGKIDNPCPEASAAFTTIDDVDIHLTNHVDAVGIQVGGIQRQDDIDTYVYNGKDICFMAPYSARIRANVQLGSYGGTGLKIINGMLWYGESQLTVHNTHNSPNAKGIDIQNFTDPDSNDRPIWQNQFSTFTGLPPNDSANKKGFMLVTSNISDPAKRIYNPSGFSVDVEETDYLTQ